MSYAMRSSHSNKLGIVGLILIQLVLNCCKKPQNPSNSKVKYKGALHTIMSGNLDATVAMDSLKPLSNLYALGALENLKGEILIFDSEPFISSVKDSTIEITRSFNKKAALLVYAQVSSWKEISIPSNLNSKRELEAFIQKMAIKKGINTNVPFPFVLKGVISSLSWHVINWQDTDTIHNHQKHKKEGLKGIINDERVDVIGFFSEHHKRVFTHHATNMHLHFKANDNLLIGHVDDLILGKKMILKLPNNGN